MGIKQGMDTENNQPAEITEDEAELYDRQIRLWGLDSQKRLREAKILLAGVGGLGAEVAKNIALAGVKSITLVDKKEVDSDIQSAQFLVVGADQGSNRAAASEARIHELNPNVEIISDPNDISEKDEEFFKDFDVVCATDCPMDVLIKLNRICRKNSKKFFCGDSWGIHGFCFADLGIQTYVKETLTAENAEDGTDEPAAKKRCTNKRMETLEFGSFEKALSCKLGKAGVGLHKKISKVFLITHILLNFRAQHNRYPQPEKRQEDLEILKSVRTTVVNNLGFDPSKVTDEDLSNVFGEISPTCAIVGGVLAQQIIKAVCGNDIPIQNFFLFDGDICSGVVENIGGS